MNEVTPDNAASATPVAWCYVFADTNECGPVTFGGNPGEEAIAWAERYGHSLKYLYSAATVTALVAESKEFQRMFYAMTDARNAEAERADAAERRVAECLKFIDGVRDDLHNRRTADWSPEGAHDAATSMSEDMRLIGNACAEFACRLKRNFNSLFWFLPNGREQRTKSKILSATTGIIL